MEALRQVADRQLVGNEQQHAQQRGGSGGRRSARSQQDEHVADMAQADIEAQVSPRDACRRREACRYDRSHADDDRPCQLRAQHEDLGDHHAGEQDEPVTGSLQHQDGEGDAKARIPWRHRARPCTRG